MPEAVKTHLQDHILEITLNRPDTLNAIDQEMHEILIGAINQVHKSKDARVILLGSTGKHFSAGGDLNEVFRIQSDPAVRKDFEDNGLAIMKALLDSPVPIIVAMHGDAHGLGANIALACDAIVACRKARMSDTHVVAGMVAGDGGCVMWPQSMGMLWAKRHLLTGDFISAEAAYARGLVTDLVDTPEEVRPAALKIAQKIAGLPPLAVQGTKRSLNRIMQQRAGEVFELSFALEQMSLMSADIREAVAAFKEKRKPVYKGE